MIHAGPDPPYLEAHFAARLLQPHRWRSFKRSKDPAFAAKAEDIVGLYMQPPIHAVVLSIDEKSQIQALDRTRPGLPLKPEDDRRGKYRASRFPVSTQSSRPDMRELRMMR
jgi:hypothetical protein